MLQSYGCGPVFLDDLLWIVQNRMFTSLMCVFNKYNKLVCVCVCLYNGYIYITVLLGCFFVAQDLLEIKNFFSS